MITNCDVSLKSANHNLTAKCTVSTAPDLNQQMHKKYITMSNCIWSSNEAVQTDTNTVELQWLELLWDYENMFETAVVRANEC